MNKPILTNLEIANLVIQNETYKKQIERLIQANRKHGEEKQMLCKLHTEQLIALNNAIASMKG